MMAAISDLPNETLLHIASFLPAQARTQLAQVDKRLNRIADDPRSWEKLYLQDAGPEAYAVARADAQTAAPRANARVAAEPRGASQTCGATGVTAVTPIWKARYAAIHGAVRKPFLTPPALARKGDRVTVRSLRQNGSEDQVCEVIRPMRMGTLYVRPVGLGHGRTPPPKRLLILPWHCIDGSKPKLVPAPVESFRDWENLQPGSMGYILPSLPLKTILTTGLRPDIHVKIQRLGLGLSGNVYFMVEEPKGARTLQELVSIHDAEKRAAAAPKGFIEGLMDNALALFGPRV